MTDSQHHEMRLEKTHPSGAEEWGCPICGRRFLLSWPPTFKRIILNPGDEHLPHSGSKGGLQLGTPQLNNVEEEPVLSEELRTALEEILADVDFEDWGNVAD